MPHFYTDPSREAEPYSLPDAEAFRADAGELAEALGWEWEQTGADGSCDEWDSPEDCAPAGFYVWSCFPGCMPDSEPTGPFETETEAVTYWREMFND